MTKKHTPAACPCGRPTAYANCCAPLHSGTPAPDAEALMRSRYSAYVLGRADYLLATWHASTRPASLDLTEEPRPKWLGLEVQRFEQTGADTAIVEFVARCRIGGRAQRLHETSRFVREDGRWYYVDGDVA
ncbi:MAG: YchJ family protein [Ignavibacteria bacterium]